MPNRGLERYVILACRIEEKLETLSFLNNDCYIRVENSVLNFPDIFLLG